MKYARVQGRAERFLVISDLFSHHSSFFYVLVFYPGVFTSGFFYAFTVSRKKKIKEKYTFDESRDWLSSLLILWKEIFLMKHSPSLLA